MELAICVQEKEPEALQEMMSLQEEEERMEV